MVDPDGKRVVDACVAGDPEALRRFQVEYLPLIYRFEGGGCAHESANQDFLTFLFDGDRLYRRLASYRGAAPLRAYLWTCILPDLLRQFRRMIRSNHLDTVALDAQPPAAGANSPAGGSGRASAALLAQLSPKKRLLFKVLYPEDFDFEPAEVQTLARRTGRSVRQVLERIEEARALVREREALQHEREEKAESAAQWLRLYERRLVVLTENLAGLDPSSPRAERLRVQHAALVRKMEKRERQRAAKMDDAARKVVTVPTDMVADILGQKETTTRAQISRVRGELARLASKGAGKQAATEGGPP